MYCCYFIIEYSQFFLLILYDFAVRFIYPYALVTQYLITITETVILQYQLRVRKNRYYIKLGFPGGSAGKESACNAGDLALIPGLGRSPAEGNGYSLQYSCLEPSMDRGAWWATVHWVAKS